MIRRFFSGRSQEANKPPVEQIEPPRAQATERNDDAFSLADWRSGPTIQTLPVDLLHPDKQGLDFVSAKELMEANRTAIEQTMDAFMNTRFIPDFEAHMIECIRRFAHWMGPLPASRAHHHSGRGGLFTHSLGVALAALHMSVAKNVTFGSSPRERDADGLAWQLICFLGGLLHDIGKVHTLGHVLAHTVVPETDSQGFRSSAAPIHVVRWEPMVEGFEGWAKVNRVRSYYIDYDIEEPLAHKDFTVRYVMALVPRPLLAYIYNSAPMVRQQFEDFIRNPESPARTPIFQIVQDADAQNVSQSMDPRRKPGSIELTPLIMRRFAEFAAETTWNLPTSPFAYAHIQKHTSAGLRYFGTTVFIANETTIKMFCEYILERPLMGVVFGERMTEMVFNALETAGVMHRTLDGLLPEQIKDPDLAGYIPASKALMRFKAKHSDAIFKAGERPEDIIIEMHVIPVKIRAAMTMHLTAPTLAFSGEPSPDSAAVVPVTVNNGAVTPADPTLANDAEYVNNLRMMLDEPERSKVTEAQLSMIAAIPKAVKPPKAKQAAPEADQGEAEGKLFAKIRKSKNRTQNAVGELDLAYAAPDTRELVRGQETPVVNTGPEWLRLYKTMLDAQDDLLPGEVWAVVWLYLKERNDPNYVAFSRATKFGIKAMTLTQTLRQDIVGAISKSGHNIKLLAESWPATGISPSTPGLDRWLLAGGKTESHQTFYLLPAACEALELFIQFDAEARE